MNQDKPQFKSPDIYRKGNVEDDRRLSNRATEQRHLTNLQSLASPSAGGTRGTQETPSHQEHNYNAKVSDVASGQGYVFKGEQRPDVVERGKKKWQYPHIKNSWDFFKS